MFIHYRSRHFMAMSYGTVRQHFRDVIDDTCPVNPRLSFRHAIVLQFDVDRPFIAAEVCPDRRTQYQPHRHKRKCNEPYPASTS